VLRLIKIATVVVVLAALAAAYRFGVFAQLSEPKAFARAVVGMGTWGYLGFIVAYAIFQPFGVPGMGFIVAAALIWPWPIAFALSMFATMAASVIGFSFARFVARDWVSNHIPARFKKYEQGLERRAFRTVLTLRLIFWMSPMLHAFLGVSRVPFWTHFWASFLGYVAPLLLVSYMGSAIFDANGRIQTRALVLFAVIGIGSLLLVIFARQYVKSRPRAT
jgi:uncharacterized membrane protein YdjX (TVP38/TMEM64 family)